ncbi:hypothetical protein ES708_15836 [subsurface metagenome]
MGDMDFPIFIAVIASAVLIIGVIVGMAVVTWVFLLIS